MNIALIGYGYWGEKIYKTLLEITSPDNIFVDDKKIINIPKDLKVKSLKEILLDKSILHVFIATPEETHFKIAKQCLQNNKNIFVEKPLCLKKKEAIELHKIAKKTNLRIYVDYIFLYDPYIKKIKDLINKNIIGNVSLIESVRCSVNIHKPNIEVTDDLAIHDIYLGKYFFNEEVTKISIVKKSLYSPKTNQASVTFNFGKMTLDANYSWVQPISTRTMKFFGEKATLIWDKNEKDLLVYKKQNLIKRINVKTDSTSLSQSIQEFIFGKSVYEYSKDVGILEKLSTK